MVDAPNEGPSRSATPVSPPPVIQLNYSQESKAVDVGRRVAGVALFLGGWRQLGFAIGLSLAMLGAGLTFRASEEAMWALWIAGLLIGLCVRIPVWRP